MRKIVITEEELYSIIENVITELNKDINEPLWNVYRIPSKIGANGYSISSSLNENNLLNQLISFAKNKWKEFKNMSPNRPKRIPGGMRDPHMSSCS